MRNTIVIIISILVLSFCNKPHLDLSDDRDFTFDTMLVFHSKLILKTPWTGEYKKIYKGALNHGFIKYNDSTVIGFEKNLSTKFVNLKSHKWILADTLEDVFLGWHSWGSAQFIELRTLEFDENKAHFYYFDGCVNPNYNSKKEIFEFYYKLKKIALLSNLSLEENRQEQLLFSTKERQ